MGDIAEMMLEGFLDEETGEVIDGDAPGYPRSPSRDARERLEARPRPPFNNRATKRHACPTCGKRFDGIGKMRQHERDAHGVGGEAAARPRKVPANPDAPGLRMQPGEPPAPGIFAHPAPSKAMPPAQQYTDPMCILRDALPILDVLIEDREALHGERDPIARDLRARIRKVVGGAA